MVNLTGLGNIGTAYADQVQKIKEQGFKNAQDQAALDAQNRDLAAQAAAIAGVGDPTSLSGLSGAPQPSPMAPPPQPMQPQAPMPPTMPPGTPPQPAQGNWSPAGGSPPGTTVPPMQPQPQFQPPQGGGQVVQAPQGPPPPQQAPQAPPQPQGPPPAAGPPGAGQGLGPAATPPDQGAGGGGTPFYQQSMQTLQSVTQSIRKNNPGIDNLTLAAAVGKRVEMLKGIDAETKAGMQAQVSYMKSMLDYNIKDRNATTAAEKADAMRQHGEDLIRIAEGNLGERRQHDRTTESQFERGVRGSKSSTPEDKAIMGVMKAKADAEKSYRTNLSNIATKPNFAPEDVEELRRNFEEGMTGFDRQMAALGRDPDGKKLTPDAAPAAPDKTLGGGGRGGPTKPKAGAPGSPENPKLIPKRPPGVPADAKWNAKAKQWQK